MQGKCGKSLSTKKLAEYLELWGILLYYTILWPPEPASFLATTSCLSG